jgi:Ni,Fe-hydrogenase III small subunit
MWHVIGRTLVSKPLPVAAPPPDAAYLAELAQHLDRRARARLGRSLSIRAVDAGSCNGCELELHALSNPFYDLERFGLRFVAAPRHADVLTVTGPVTRNMREALERTYAAMPDPKWVVAIGNCAVDGGLFAGSPPAPIQLLGGLLALLEAASRPVAEAPPPERREPS